MKQNIREMIDCESIRREASYRLATFTNNYFRHTLFQDYLRSIASVSDTMMQTFINEPNLLTLDSQRKSSEQLLTVDEVQRLLFPDVAVLKNEHRCLARYMRAIGIGRLYFARNWKNLVETREIFGLRITIEPAGPVILWSAGSEQFMSTGVDVVSVSLNSIRINGIPYGSFRRGQYLHFSYGVAELDGRLIFPIGE